MMMEKAQAFREHLVQVEDEDLFSSIVDFSSHVATDFTRDFPQYPKTAYELSPLWQLLNGSTVPLDHQDTTPPEVQVWLERKIAEFLSTLEI